jgi:uncharacterized membrane protein YfcA
MIDPFLILLFFVSAGSTFFGTIIGGAAFVNVPIMIFSGIPAQIAVATQKFGALGLTTSGMYKYNKGRKVNFRLGLGLAVFMAIGSVLGSYVLLQTGDELIEISVIVIMSAMLLLILKEKSLGIKKIRKKISTRNWVVGILASFFLGIYAGFFGAGLGALMSFVLLAVFGQTFLESAGTRKVMAFPAIIISLAIFIFYDKIVWPAAIALLIGSLIGSYFGAAYSMKKGDEWVRRVFIVLVAVLIAGMIIF